MSYDMMRVTGDWRSNWIDDTGCFDSGGGTRDCLLLQLAVRSLHAWTHSVSALWIGHADHRSQGVLHEEQAADGGSRQGKENQFACSE